jgi:glutamate decarboxylase
MKLFLASDHAVAAENEGQSRVAAMVKAFLSEPAVSSGVDFCSLVRRFADSKVPDGCSNERDYLDYLAENVVPHSIRTSSPRCIGNMTSALPHFTRPLGTLLLAMNQNLVKVETSKVLSLLERQALAMMHRLVYGLTDQFYLDSSGRFSRTLGILASGGTLANVTALWCARNVSLGPRGAFKGVANDGLAAALQYYRRDGAVIVGSALMHYSMEKAADLLGIGAGNLIRVPVDQRDRISLPALEDALSTCRSRNQHVIAIVGVAGSTDSGSIDPLSELADIASKNKCHFHVDAAWGGPLLFSERHRYKLAGIERADSVTIDGHKQMYLPTGIGMVLFRRCGTPESIRKHASYAIRPASGDLGKDSLEGSRAGNGLFLHAALHIIGRNGYEFLIDQSMSKARYMADAIGSRPEFELLREPESNIILYRYLPAQFRRKMGQAGRGQSETKLINDFNTRLQKAQRRAGTTFVSRTTVSAADSERAPITALRAVISNPLITAADIDEVLTDQHTIATTLLDQGKLGRV